MESKRKLRITVWGISIAVVVAIILGMVGSSMGPSASPGGMITVNSVVFGAAPEKSGIENIYIMETGYDNTADLFDQTTYILGVITASEGSVNVDAAQVFDIVIAFKAHGDNLGYIHLDNAKMQWEVSGAYTIGAATVIVSENEIMFENSAPVGTPAKNTENYMRVNAVGAIGWVLNAGQSISLDNVSLWIWG